MNDNHYCDFNNLSDEDIANFRNICSWLLVFTPVELTVISAILAIIITPSLTLAEQAVVGTFFTSFADNILLISAQQLLINTAIDEQKQINDKIKDKEESKKQAQEKEKQIAEIKQLKEKIEKLEELLNSHLNNSLI